MLCDAQLWVEKHIFLNHNKPQHKKEARQYMWLIVFCGTTFTKKVCTEPLKKVQNMILQQSNIFRSGN